MVKENHMMRAKSWWRKNSFQRMKREEDRAYMIFLKKIATSKRLRVFSMNNFFRFFSTSWNPECSTSPWRVIEITSSDVKINCNCYIWDSLRMICGIFRLYKFWCNFKLGCDILLDLTKLNWLIWSSLMRSYYCRTWGKIMVQYDYTIFYIKNSVLAQYMRARWIPLSWTPKLQYALLNNYAV